MISNKEFVSLYCGWCGKGRYALLSITGSMGYVYINRSATTYLPFNTTIGPIKFIILQETR